MTKTKFGRNEIENTIVYSRHN
ncbi:hypothetical protein CCACVL1_23965 [Corchorus capsularis]|uniref:Uncharacterized protein n=1 Tax=Corchorus capsularis TaxID=210143 RepID=A0A1R3GRH3_COCAP|nr:hypothetical protein CCACVL1_23965 [Corchorus capsularis]